MNLTVQGYALIIYLAANGFMTYTMYCAMKIFFDQPPAQRGWAISSYVLYGLGVSAVYLLFNQPALTFVANVVLLGCITCTYKGSWQRRCIAIIFTYVLALLCEAVALVLMDAGGTVHFTRFDDQEFIVAQIVVRIVNYMSVMFISHFRVVHGHDQIQRIPWIAVIAVPVCTALPILTLVIIGAEKELPIIALSIIGLFAINILVFYLYEHIAELYQDKWEGRLTDEQIKAYQQQDELYHQQQEVLEELRHDLKNHVIAQPSSMEAKQYEKDLLDKLQPPECHVSTGIAAADAILNYKFAQAEKQEMKMKLDICLPNRLQAIREADICAVLGNLLDNALRATAELPAENRWMRLTMTYRQQVLTITIVNPYRGKLKEKYGRLLTTKRDAEEHGIGLRSVQRIADKYHGQLELSHDWRTFTAEIWLSDARW